MPPTPGDHAAPPRRAGRRTFPKVQAATSCRENGYLPSAPTAGRHSATQTLTRQPRRTGAAQLALGARNPRLAAAPRRVVPAVERPAGARAVGARPDLRCVVQVCRTRRRRAQRARRARLPARQRPAPRSRPSTRCCTARRIRRRARPSHSSTSTAVSIPGSSFSQTKPAGVRAGGRSAL